jgi:endonuclease/exonuclease/phosphatase family metal-dependent hydrolase
VNAVRRGLLKFDTQATIPARALITSAKLTVYVRAGAGKTTRRIGVYPVSSSFQETQATWTVRKTGYNWGTAGGDLGTKIGELTAPVTAGTPLTIDVKTLVQRSVNDSSSRFTRLALIDVDTIDTTSWREFHSSETTTAAYRPKLEVVYTLNSTPPPATSTGTTLKVLDYNTHYGGGGTDGVFNPDRVIDTIVRLNPDLVSLNELTVKAYYDSQRDLPAYYAAELTRKTGRRWYYTFRTDNGAATGVGDAVLSRFPIASTSHCQLSARRVAVNAAVYVNGRLINMWSTHLDSSSTSNAMRMTEVRALQSCVGSFAEEKIVAGDFNAKATTSEITLMKTQFVDGWLHADESPSIDAVSFPGNTSFGATRNARIDYVFYSKNASHLVLKRAEVFDTRDSRGVMPSDHKPLMLTFEVR